MIIVRAASEADYAAIADIHVRAFEHRVAEALIVALHRQRAAFDAALSLVAVESDRIIGHALFSPRFIRLLGHDVSVVNLAPIAVLPSEQGRGVGARLIEHGHAIARLKGYAASLLVGHPGYYPRFGYRTYAFGDAVLQVTLDDDRPVTPLAVRAPVAADVAALWQLWRVEEDNVDCTIVPDATLLAWLSPNPQIKALVFTRAEQIVGYARVHTDAVAAPRMFLAADDAAAWAMVVALARSANTSTLTLPLHPRSRSAPALGSAQVEAWEAAMIAPFHPRVFADYAAQLEQSERSSGRVIWPVEFDLE